MIRPAQTAAVVRVAAEVQVEEEAQAVAEAIASRFLCTNLLKFGIDNTSTRQYNKA